MIKLLIYITLFLSLGIYNLFAQSYTKDSLQFKVYTIASFKDSHVTAIELDKVFCDYCSKSQLTAIGQLSLKSSNKLVKKAKYRLTNGKKRLAIYLRIAKKDFAYLKQRDTIR